MKNFKYFSKNSEYFFNLATAHRIIRKLVVIAVVSVFHSVEVVGPGISLKK